VSRVYESPAPLTAKELDYQLDRAERRGYYIAITEIFENEWHKLPEPVIDSWRSRVGVWLASPGLADRPMPGRRQ
jgi:hypothetical protein